MGSRENLVVQMGIMTDLLVCRESIMTDLRSTQEAVSLLLRLMRLSFKNTQMNVKLRRVF